MSKAKVEVKNPRQCIPNLVKLIEKSGRKITFSEPQPEQRYAKPGLSYDVALETKNIGRLHISGEAEVIYYFGKVPMDISPQVSSSRKGFCDPNIEDIMLLAERRNEKYHRHDSRDWIPFP